MRAITTDNLKNSELVTADFPLPVPNAEQLLVRVKAAGVNRADLLQRQGKYPPPPGESSILGLEIAGEILECGNRVKEFKTGNRVFGLVGSGGYADYCLIDQHSAMLIPNELSFVEAAAIPEAFLTASEALFHLGNLQRNEVVLIHAGGSGVGTAAIQLAKFAGAKVFVTTGSIDKIPKLKMLGADEVICYKKSDFAALIKNLGGVDVILDLVGANYFESNCQILNMHGRLICIGLMGGAKTQIDLSLIIRKRLQIKGLIMRSLAIAEKQTITERFKKNWLPLFTTCQLQPIIDSIYPFDQVNSAHAHLERNANFGKIVLQIA